MREKALYWISTGIVCFVMTFSIVNFVFNDHFPFPDGKETAFAHLGLPHYFKIELTTAKVLGVLALLLPGVPRKVKEFAYFGFGLTLLSAAIAHYSVGDARNLSVIYVLDPLLFFGVLVVSYVYWNRIWVARSVPQSVEHPAEEQAFIIARHTTLHPRRG